MLRAPTRQLIRGVVAFAALICLMPILIQAQTVLPPPPNFTRAQPRIPTDQWIVKLVRGVNPQAVAAQFNMFYVGPLMNMPGYHILKAPAIDTRSTLQSANLTRGLRSVAGVTFAMQDHLNLVDYRAPADPLYSYQWHLEQANDQDIDVEGAWAYGYTGTGIRVAVVDEGLEYTHPDLAPNYIGGYDYADGDADPFPVDNPFYEQHGTAVAGLAVGADDGQACGVGVAYDGSLVGVRALTNLTDSVGASAIAHGAFDNSVDVSNNSWGPQPNGTTFGGAPVLHLEAIANGATYGRGGRGIIYTWAAGNGYQNDDYAGADSYVNSRYTIPVAALTSTGTAAAYSEEGAGILISAPADGTWTADRIGAGGYGPGQCATFIGTSSAAPTVAGVIALMLQANPNLTWRDVQGILIESAVKHNDEPGWEINAYGNPIHHRYGYGMVNARAAVELTLKWDLLGPEFSADSGLVRPDLEIPDGGTLTQTIDITSAITLEQAMANVKIDHARRGDLRIELVSPQGTNSVLLDSRALDDGANIPDPIYGQNLYPFKTVRLWGENAAGTWTLRITDTNANGISGRLKVWRLRLFGTSPFMIDHLQNGSFEDTELINSRLMPQNWQAASVSNGNHFLKATPYADDDPATPDVYSFSFGPGGTAPQNIIIKQTLNQSFPAGTVLFFGGRARPLDAPNGTRLILKVRYTDGTLQNVTLPIKGGRYRWRAYAKTFVAPKPIQSVQLLVRYYNSVTPVTRIYIDRVFLHSALPPP